MTNKIADRLACIAALVSRKQEVRHVRLSDGILSVFKWYGVHRCVASHRVTVTTINDELDWIDLGMYGVAWPRRQPRSRFIGTLVELRAPSNAHYYFDELTPIRQGSIVVDIGASEGAFALECLVRHNAAHVWCFEPDSSMNRAFKVAAERNHLAERLHLVSAAAARSTESMQILENATDPLAPVWIDRVPAAGQKELMGVLRKVEGVSLDDWAAQNAIERIDYLKIDAEGSDLAVLQGGRMCLERWRPAIAVTTYHQANHCNEMIEYLSSLDLGYRFRVKGVIAFHGVARPMMLHGACHGIEAGRKS